jgi:hypothetical protein
MEKATIQELSTSVLAELQRLGYASGTIAFYRRTYQKLIRYAEANRIQQYSIEVGERWLKESFGIDLGLVVNNGGGLQFKMVLPNPALPMPYRMAASWVHRIEKARKACFSGDSSSIQERI